MTQLRQIKSLDYEASIVSPLQAQPRPGICVSVMHDIIIPKPLTRTLEASRTHVQLTVIQNTHYTE